MLASRPSSTPFCCLWRPELAPTQYLFLVAKSSWRRTTQNYCSLLLPRHYKVENRMNYGPNLKIINLKDQASHDFGGVRFKKLKICWLIQTQKKSFTEIYLFASRHGFHFVSVCNCLTSFNKRAHYDAYHKCHGLTCIKCHPLITEGDHEIEVL